MVRLESCKEVGVGPPSTVGNHADRAPHLVPSGFDSIKTTKGRRSYLFTRSPNGAALPAACTSLIGDSVPAGIWDDEQEIHQAVAHSPFGLAHPRSGLPNIRLAKLTCFA